MSKQQATAFLDSLSDQRLRGLVGQRIEATDVVELGAEQGYEFTVNELLEAQKDIEVEGELSDEDLDGVAGGFHTFILRHIR